MSVFATQGDSVKGTFDNKNICEVKGEPQDIAIICLKALCYCVRVTVYKKAQAEAAAVQLIMEDEDNNEKDKAEEEVLEVEFAAIEVILD